MDGVGVGLVGRTGMGEELLPNTSACPALPCKAVDGDEKTPVTSAHHGACQAGRVLHSRSGVPGTAAFGARQAGCGEVWDSFLKLSHVSHLLPV